MAIHGWARCTSFNTARDIPVPLYVSIAATVNQVSLYTGPESPRQLLFNGRREECVHVIRRIYPAATEEQVEAKVLSIERGVREAKALNEEISIKASLGLLFKRPANRRAGIAACGLMFFQQVSDELGTYVQRRVTYADLTYFPVLRLQHADVLLINPL